MAFPFPDGVFGPQDIQTMTTALEEVCKALDLRDDAKSERGAWQRKSFPLLAKASAVPSFCASAS